jgi:HKD family nuclease
MSGRRSSTSVQTRARLLDLWTGEEAFGRPVGCVTTSFTFDAELFEEQCLSRFLSIQSNPNETMKAYLIEREEKLAQCFACVLVDRAHAAADRSLRWHMLPVRLPGGGVLHAKLTLLVWENFIRVLIGSANLTEPAYRRNQEVMAALDFGGQGNPAPELLSECVAFLHRVRRLAPGFDRSDVGPQVALANFLASVERRARSLPPADRNDAECVLIPLVPGGKTVVQQLSTQWVGPRPDRAWVLSPFFDEDARAGATAAAFATLLTARGERRLSFAGPGRTLPDGTVQIDAPATLKKPSHPSLQHAFSIVEQRIEIEGKQEDRSLHAKSVWLERDDRALYMLGSSNFTAAGLGLHPRHNIELNLAYIIRDRGSRFGKLCAQSWPPEHELDDIEGVQFLGGLPNSADDADAPRLPTAFGLALFCLDERGARLELEIGTDAPPVFSVLSKDHGELLDGQGWVRSGRPRTVVLPWDTKRPPSSLEVRWQDDAKGEWSAPWVVNVADMSALPPPDELGSLSLSELIEILTSARPLHEVVLRILQRRETQKPSGTPLEVDPHKKVDTSQFLLRRMRRVAEALEGMRDRLQQPVSSFDALRWRLRGPIGPVALAKRLSAEDPDGAAFMIAEVAATLRSVAWKSLGTLSPQAIGPEVAEITRSLQDLARQAPAPPSLAAYVTTTFEELLS